MSESAACPYCGEQKARHEYVSPSSCVLSSTASAATTGVTLADDAFARLVGSAGEGVLLFEVAQDFIEEEWSEPVRYRFVRTEGGLLSMEVARV